MKKPPKHLRPAGAAFFGSVLADYAINDSAGLALLQAAAEAVDRMTAAREAIDRDGEIIRDRYDCPKTHPACSLERDARSGFLAAMRGLNLELEPPRPMGRPPLRN
jgi:hypothetical protein